WAPTADAALYDTQRVIAYVGIFGLALLAVGSGRFGRHLVWGVLVTSFVIVGAGLLSRIYPNILDGGGPTLPQAEARLAYPLGYWNAFGALAAFCTVLAVGLAADPRTPVPLRAITCGMSVLSAMAMYFSLSRGGWLSLAVGLVVL